MMKEYNRRWNENIITKQNGTPGYFLCTFCVIPRITLFSINSSYPLKFDRRQFPIRHAYVMIINKTKVNHWIGQQRYHQNRILNTIDLIWLLSMWFFSWWQEQDRNEMITYDTTSQVRNIDMVGGGLGQILQKCQNSECSYEGSFVTTFW